MAAARKKSSSTVRKKTTARKKTTVGKKSSGRKKAVRKYSRKAGRKVEKVMREMKRGELKSGRSGRTVKSRKQAIAIALSEARREGDKVPDQKG